MSLEQQVAILSQRVGELIHRVTTQADKWDAIVNAKKSELEAYIANARAEYPFIRISKNQILERDANGNLIDWEVRNCTIVESIYVEDGTTSRPAIANELLSALTGGIPQWISKPFYILRIKVSDNIPDTGETWVLAPTFGNAPKWSNFPPLATYLTGIAVIKFLYGNVTMNYSLLKRLTNGWNLYGKIYESFPFFYAGFHMYFQPGSDFYIALPGVVLGRYPYETKNWSYFMNIYDEAR